MGLIRNIHEAFWDLWHSIKTHGLVFGSPLEQGSPSYPTPYYVLKKLSHLKGHTLLDVGMGTGRVLKFFSSRGGFSHLAGCEQNEVVFKQAKINLKNTEIELIHGDVLDLDVSGFDTFFFYHAFEGVLLDAFIDKLLKNSRPVTVIYVDPLELEVFLGAGFKVIEEIHDEKFPVVILRKG